MRSPFAATGRSVRTAAPSIIRLPIPAPKDFSGRNSTTVTARRHLRIRRVSHGQRRIWMSATAATGTRRLLRQRLRRQRRRYHQRHNLPQRRHHRRRQPREHRRRRPLRTRQRRDRVPEVASGDGMTITRRNGCCSHTPAVETVDASNRSVPDRPCVSSDQHPVSSVVEPIPMLHARRPPQRRQPRQARPPQPTLRAWEIVSGNGMHAVTAKNGCFSLMDAWAPVDVFTRSTTARPCASPS